MLRSASPSPHCSASVLVVDDDPVMRSFMEHLLTPTYDVATAGTAADALAHLHDAPPDVLVLDLNLPDLDGHGLLKQMRDTDRIDDVPVLVLSGRDASDDRVTSLRLGAQDHLDKPFNPQELQARLERLLPRA